MLIRLHHERLYRGEALLQRLAATRFILCGAGAVGSNLADTLVRQGAACMRLIDDDRVEVHNTSTQIYAQADIGLFKAEALRNHLFRASGVEIDAVRKRFTSDTAGRLLKDTDLVVDAFDNSASRAVVQERCRAANLPCLHVGLAGDYAEIIWDERYKVPDDGGRDICDYPLARNLVLLAATVAAETILHWLATGVRTDWTITLADLAIRPMASGDHGRL